MKTYIASLFACLLLLGAGCALVSKFDEGSLSSDMILKKQALALMQHATEPAIGYAQIINALNSDLSSMIAKEKGKGKSNWVIQKEWELITSPDHLLGKFLKQWQEGPPFDQKYIDEESILIGDAFDQLIQAEAAKIH